MSILKKGEIHRSALEGFKEGTVYEKYRPEYADEFVLYVIENLFNGRRDADYDILELGAGTGKFTRKILDKFTNLQHHRYLATDPLKDFLSFLEQATPELTTNECSASNIPLPSCSVQGNKKFMLNHFMSISVIVRLDLEEKQKAERKFRAVLDDFFTDDETIDLPLKSEYYCAEKV